MTSRRIGIAGLLLCGVALGFVLDSDDEPYVAPNVVRDIEPTPSQTPSAQEVGEAVGVELRELGIDFGKFVRGLVDGLKDELPDRTTQ